MPRRSKNQQAPAAAPGQPYGEAGDQIQAQNVIPLPQQTAPTPGGQPGSEEQAPVAGGNPLEAAVAAAMGTPPPGGSLTAPSVRPNEPVTNGLPIGEGAGQEALNPQSPARRSTAADTFLMLAEITGNSRYRELAMMARRQGI
jgi:hypothetical protein